MADIDVGDLRSTAEVGALLALFCRSAGFGRPPAVDHSAAGGCTAQPVSLPGTGSLPATEALPVNCIATLAARKIYRQILFQLDLSRPRACMRLGLLSGELLAYVSYKKRFCDFDYWLDQNRVTRESFQHAVFGAAVYGAPCSTTKRAHFTRVLLSLHDCVFPEHSTRNVADQLIDLSGLGCADADELSCCSRWFVSDRQFRESRPVQPVPAEAMGRILRTSVSEPVLPSPAFFKAPAETTGEAKSAAAAGTAAAVAVVAAEAAMAAAVTAKAATATAVAAKAATSAAAKAIAHAAANAAAQAALLVAQANETLATVAAAQAAAISAANATEVAVNFAVAQGAAAAQPAAEAAAEAKFAAATAAAAAAAAAAQITPFPYPANHRNRGRVDKSVSIQLSQAVVLQEFIIPVEARRLASSASLPIL